MLIIMHNSYTPLILLRRSPPVRNTAVAPFNSRPVHLGNKQFPVFIFSMEGISEYYGLQIEVHRANEYASFQKLFRPWFAEDDPKGFSSIPRLLSEL
jgi:hypothetical protein